MGIELDHLILSAAERAASIAFYTKILGLTYDGEDGPFARIRVTPGFVLLLAAGKPVVAEHLAFALPKRDFDAAFDRIRAAGIAFGDAFDAVGNMRGPAPEAGARGTGEALYVFDPDRHLIEIRHYERRADAERS